MAAFWELGYERTSMTVLLSRMGIQKGSFYATFSSKHEVYERAVAHYVRERFASFEREMGDGSPRVAIERMFDIAVRECRGKDASLGCLIVNAALERAPDDEAIGRVVRDTLGYQEKFLADLVERGQRAGDIATHRDPKAIAQGLMATLIAMRVYARAGMPKSRIRSLRAQVDVLLA